MTVQVSFHISDGSAAPSPSNWDYHPRVGETVLLDGKAYTVSEQTPPEWVALTSPFAGQSSLIVQQVSVTLDPV